MPRVKVGGVGASGGIDVGVVYEGARGVVWARLPSPRGTPPPPPPPSPLPFLPPHERPQWLGTEENDTDLLVVQSKADAPKVFKP